jgi:Na+-driven multidrug efflux pump
VDERGGNLDERDHRVLEGPIVRTLVEYAVPSLIALLAISTTSLVDGVFVGRFVGGDALAAVGLLVPYFTLLFGVALMLAVGGTVRAGRRLGADERGRASVIFASSLLGVLALGAVSAVAGSVFDETLFRMLRAPAGLVPPMRAYFEVIAWVLPLQLAGLVLYYFVRLDGRPRFATVAVACGAACNLALDAWFVAELGLGLQGAALATGIAQLVQAVALASHFAAGRGRLRLRLVWGGARELGAIALGGVSELVNEVSAGLVFLVFNFLMLERRGAEGIAAFSVVNYAIFVSLMVFYGVADALHPLVSQNLGAGRMARVRGFARAGLAGAAAFGALFFGALRSFSDGWAAVFLSSSSAPLLAEASKLLELVSPLFLVNGLNVVTVVYFASIQRSLHAALLSMARTLVLPLTALLGFFFFLPEAPFVLALPCAEWLTLGVAVFLLGRVAPELGAELDARAAEGGAR